MKNKCKDDQFKDRVVVLVNKTKCEILNGAIIVKDGEDPKECVFKIKGWVVPKSIDINFYIPFFLNKKDVEHIEYYNESL